MESYHRKSYYKDKAVAETYCDKRFSSAKGGRENEATKVALESAFDKLPDLKRVLDMPCGNGRFSHFIRGRGYRYVGADISMEMLEVMVGAQGQGTAPFLVRCDGEYLPFKNDVFDCVVCVRFLNLVPPAVRHEILAEMKRVSKKWLIVQSHQLKSMGPLMRLKIIAKRVAGGDLRKYGLRKEIRGAGWVEEARVRIKGTRQCVGIFRKTAELRTGPCMDSAVEEKELLAQGYRSLEHAGISWLATEQGSRFLKEVEDWSQRALTLRQGWTGTRRQYHLRYLAEDRDQNRYFIKTYFAKKEARRLFVRKKSRATREFRNTLAAHRKGIQTVLPVAVGEQVGNLECNVIIYSFLEHSASLPALYAGAGLPAVRERQSLEKVVGRMARRIVDSGLYPRDLVLDHFLVRQGEGGTFQVYWVDVERVKFTSLFRKRKGIRILARLLAQMQRFKNLGYRINRSSMMRIAHAFAHKKAFEKMDRKSCREVIRAAQKFWFRKGWDKKPPDEAFPLKL